MPAKTSENARFPEEILLCVKETRKRLSSLSSGEFVSNELFAPATHLLNQNGKLIRPALVFIGAQALDEEPEEFIDLALAVELLHTSSLIHDDIIDGDNRRRETISVHRKYGKEAAILAGDALISKAISLSSVYGPQVMKAISKATMDMCAGEILDYAYQRDRKVPDMQRYLQIAGLKSASLIGTACSIAATYKSSKLENELYEFGKDSGIAFQIRDDLAEFSGTKKARDAELSRYRPNVVRTFQKHSSLDEASALGRARELNLHYLRKALNRIQGRRVKEMLSPYINAITAHDS